MFKTLLLKYCLKKILKTLYYKVSTPEISLFYTDAKCHSDSQEMSLSSY